MKRDANAENPKNILAVEALNNFKLKVNFEDGDKIVDMKTFKLLGAFKKIIENEKFFGTVHLDEGIVTWEGGLMLENNDLYYHGIQSKKQNVASLKKVLQKLVKYPG